MPSKAFQHPTLFAVMALNDRLRALLDELRKRKKPDKPDREKQKKDREKKRPHGGGLPPIWVPGSGQAEAQAFVESGGSARPPDSGTKRRPCEKKGNDRFSLAAYLQCRCRNGDSQSCKALAKMTGSTGGSQESRRPIDSANRNG